jgi:pyruvate-formate lyase-activating enzyme/TusA-related sulfurtransferase
MHATKQVVGGTRRFAGGLLVDLAAAMRDARDGELIAVTSSLDETSDDLAVWSRLTGHAIVSTELSPGAHRWIVRKGVGRLDVEPPRPIGSRLWLYSNFDCNLSCDYCCVRSSPSASRRELGLERVQRIAREAAALGVESLFVTGGEPLLLANIGEILETCADVAPTTMLTNGMLLHGSRLERLRSLPSRGVVLQISVDSAAPDLHDLHRGSGSWAKALRGVRAARDAGFRVRLAATVSSDEDEASFREFLDRESVAEEDRLVRRIALRGFAEEGVALAKGDLVPEVTLTADGVYWHPVGATDNDFLVSSDLFPLSEAFDAVRAHWQKERAIHESLAELFHCA